MMRSAQAEPHDMSVNVWSKAKTKFNWNGDKNFCLKFYSKWSYEQIEIAQRFSYLKRKKLFHFNLNIERFYAHLNIITNKNCHSFYSIRLDVSALWKLIFQTVLESYKIGRIKWKQLTHFRFWFTLFNSLSVFPFYSHRLNSTM